MWTQKFQKPMSDLKAELLIQGTREKIRKLLLFGIKYSNVEIWTRNFENEITELKLPPSK